MNTLLDKVFRINKLRFEGKISKKANLRLLEESKRITKEIRESEVE